MWLITKIFIPSSKNTCYNLIVLKAQFYSDGLIITYRWCVVWTISPWTYKGSELDSSPFRGFYEYWKKEDLLYATVSKLSISQSPLCPAIPSHWPDMALTAWSLSIELFSRKSKWKEDWSKFVFLVIQRRRNFAFETKLEGTRQVLGVSNREPLFLRKCRYQNSKQGSYSNDWWETTQRRLRQGKYKHKHKPIYAICTTCRLPQLQKCLMIFGHGCMNLGTISTLIIQRHFVKFK